MKILGIDFGIGGDASAGKPAKLASELICAIDVGTTKIVALIAELDDENNLRVIGVGRVPAQGLRRGVVVNTNEATAAIGQAIALAEETANQTIPSALVGIAGSHINAMGSKGAVAIRGRTIAREDTLRALEQAKNIAVPHNREIILAVPRVYTVDDQKGIQDPNGMFAYRLEVDASLITGATSAVTNLANCVLNNGVEIESLVLQPLASAKAVLNPDESQLGVALVDMGGGTTDLAIFLEGSPWHTVVLDVGGDHFVRDVATGLRMPYSKAEALMKQFGSVQPGRVPVDAEVRSGAFGEEGHQIISRRVLAEILNARAEEVLELVRREVHRSGYDGLLPAGIVLTGGLAQLTDFGELARDRLQWPTRIGRPTGIASSVVDLSSPEYATAVGLLLWGLRQDGDQGSTILPPDPLWKRLLRWIENLFPR